MYDDFYWMNHFGDPGYRYHTLMSQLWGVTAMRLANADALPFDIAAYARNVREFVLEVEAKRGVRQNLRLDTLLAELKNLQQQGSELKAALRDAPEDKLQSTNRRLMQVERNWLNDAGIPGRPWFKHVLYAARYTYAHLELPGLTEAVEKQDWKTAKEQT